MSVLKVKSEKIQFVKGENYDIPNNSKVKVIQSDNKVIIKNSWKSNDNLKNYKRLSANKYKDEYTNTIKDYKKKYYKTKKSINKNMRHLKLLIQCNFSYKHNTLFLTLTCKNNVTDIKEIREYTRHFIRRLKRKYKQYEFIYIYKFERGTRYFKWHLHMLLRDINNKEIANVITNEEITNLWEQGFTSTQKVYGRKIYFSPNELKGISKYE